MRKQITLLVVIVIVFIIFYSVYYYSNFRVHHVPIINDVSELDSTVLINSQKSDRFSKNLLYSTSLKEAFNSFRDSYAIHQSQFSDLNTFSHSKGASLQPFNQFTVESFGKFNDTTLSRLKKLENRYLQNDFEFRPDWKKGEWYLFAHYYYPVLFKNSLKLDPQPLNFEGRKVRTLISTQRGNGRSQKIQTYEQSKNKIALEFNHPENGQLVIAMLPPSANLKQTYQQTKQWISNNEGNPLTKNKGVKLPVMDLYLTHNHQSSVQIPAKGEHILNTCHRISFSINAEYSFLTSEPSNADLKFNKPFLVYHIPSDGKVPIFMMWVANPEVLMPFD